MKKMEWGKDPEFHGPRNYFRESLMIHEIRKYKIKGNVLDFGCGSGTLIFRLVSLGYRLVGVDVSRQAIKFLSDKVKTKRLSRQIIVINSDENILRKKKYRKFFDVIVAGEVLEHIFDDKGVIKIFYSLLKHEGICAISVPAHPDLWDINDDFSNHFRRYEKKELINLFHNTGFKVIKAYYWGYPLSLYWHKFIYNRLVRNKINKDINYTKTSVLTKLIKRESLLKLFSLPFWFDQLFNWTKKGGGLILIALKE
jgi:2-polyprenyl-3-methyl-5-hydroxy-6-metoxy-1,4-benzoquinol methylase